MTNRAILVIAAVCLMGAGCSEDQPAATEHAVVAECAPEAVPAPAAKTKASRKAEPTPEEARAAARKQELEKALYDVDRMRGENATIPQAVAECERLLTLYDTPEEHGQIYFALASFCANQSEGGSAETIEWSAKAMEFPLTPDQKQKVYEQWHYGILQVAGNNYAIGDPWPEREIRTRQKAIVPLLQALQALEEYDLPEGRLEVPAIPRTMNCCRLGDEDDEHAEEEARKLQPLIEERERIEFLNKMIYWRTRQFQNIACLYIFSSKLYIPEELETLARTILTNEKTIEMLMADVQKRREETIAHRKAQGMED